MAVIVYDDECGFCTALVFWLFEDSEHSLCGFSELNSEQKERLPQEYESCSHVLREGGVVSCGECVTWWLRDVGFLRLAWFSQLPFVNRVRDVGYCFIAKNRSVISRVIKVLS